MSDDPVISALTRLEAGLTAVRSETTTQRVDLMARMDRLQDSLVGLRDDMAALTAITTRLDGSHTALLTQLRAMHSQQVRLTNRVRDLEAKAP